MQLLKNKFYNLTDKQQLAIFILVLTAFLFFAFQTLIVPLRAQRIQQEADLRELYVEMANLSYFDMSDKEFFALKQEVGTANILIKRILPDKINSFENIERLSTEIKKSNVKVVSLKVLDEHSKKNNLHAQVLECNLQGNYFDILKLLNALQNIAPLTDVQLTRFTSASDGKLNITLHILTYSLH